MCVWEVSATQWESSFARSTASRQVSCPRGSRDCDMNGQHCLCSSLTWQQVSQVPVWLSSTECKKPAWETTAYSPDRWHRCLERKLLSSTTQSSYSVLSMVGGWLCLFSDTVRKSKNWDVWPQSPCRMFGPINLSSSVIKGHLGWYWGNLSWY